MAWYTPLTIGLPEAFTRATASLIARHFEGIRDAMNLLPPPDRIRRGQLTFAEAGADDDADPATFALTMDRGDLPALPDLDGYLPGQRVSWIAHEANTGAVTVRVEGGPKVALNDSGGNPLTVGELVAGDYYEAVYDGGSFRVVEGHTVINRQGQATSGLSHDQIIGIVDQEIARRASGPSVVLTDTALDIANPTTESRSAAASRRAIAAAVASVEGAPPSPAASVTLFGLVSAAAGPYTAAQFTGGTRATGRRIALPASVSDAYVGIWKSGDPATFIGPNDLSPLLGLFTEQAMVVEVDGMDVEGYQYFSEQLTAAAITEPAPGWVVR